MFKITHSKLTAERPWMFQSRRRLFLTLFLVLAVPTAALTTLTALFLSGELREQAVKQNSVTARLVARQLDEKFFELRRYVESFATRPKLIESLQANEAKTVQQQLAELIEQNRKLSRATITDSQAVLRFDYPNDPEIIGKAFSERDWFKGAANSDESYVSEVYQRSALGRAKVVMVATKIKDEGNDVLGYLGAQYAIADMMEWLQQLHPSPSDRIAIFDQNGNQMLRVNASRDLNISLNPKIQGLLQKPEGILRVDRLNGFSDCMLSYVPIPDLGWTVISYQPVEVIFAPVERLLNTILIFFLIALLALGLLGWLWYHALFAFAEDLRRSNKELESFCYSIAHDLRSPLRAMQGFTTMLTENYADKLDDEGKQCARRIVTGAERMDKLINDLLEYGIIAYGNLDFETVDLTQSVRNAMHDMATPIQMTRGEVSVRNPLGTVSSDKKLLQRMLEHLLSNALKFVAQSVKPRIEIWSEHGKKTVRLWIKDNGIGIDPKYRENIFGVFHRLHATGYSGTGIGLAIVKKGAERMGAVIGVESEPGKGSAFWIELPRQ